MPPNYSHWASGMCFRGHYGVSGWYDANANEDDKADLWTNELREIFKKAIDKRALESTRKI